MHSQQLIPSRPAPLRTHGLVHRLRANFFSNPGTSLATIVIALVLPALVLRLLNWALLPAADEVLDMLVVRGRRDAGAWAKAMRLGGV